MKRGDRGFMLDKILENEALQIRDWLNARWVDHETAHTYVRERWYIGGLPPLRQFLLGNRPISIYSLFIMCQDVGLSMQRVMMGHLALMETKPMLKGRFYGALKPAQKSKGGGRKPRATSQSPPSSPLSQEPRDIPPQEGAGDPPQTRKSLSWRERLGLDPEGS